MMAHATLVDRDLRRFRNLMLGDVVGFMETREDLASEDVLVPGLR